MLVSGPLVEHILTLSADRPTPLVVAIDGGSGAGKSTLAAAVAAGTGAAVIDGDDFYAGATAAEWDAMTPVERVERCIDWRRLRPVLTALAERRPARWHPYDWEADDGRLTNRAEVRRPGDVVILEGVYSARPELADLVHLRVLLAVPAEVRRERVRRREGRDYQPEWEARWTAAEEHYFTVVMPPSAFDLVVG